MHVLEEAIRTQIAYSQAGGAGEDPQWSVVVFDGTEPYANIHGDQVHEAATLNQLAIVHGIGVLGISSDRTLPLETTDRQDGDGILRFRQPGTPVRVDEARYLALSLGDTTAAAFLVRAGGGPLKLNDALAKTSSLPQTQLKPVDPHNKDAAAPFSYGQTTAFEAARLWQSVRTDPLNERALAQSPLWSNARSSLEEQPSRQRGSLLAQMITQGYRFSRGHLSLPIPSHLYKAHIALVAQNASISAFPNKIANTASEQHEVIQIGTFTLAVLTSGHDTLNLPYAAQTTKIIGRMVAGEAKVDLAQLAA